MNQGLGCRCPAVVRNQVGPCDGSRCWTTPDRGLRSGQDGVLTPHDYRCIQEAIDGLIASQQAMIARLTAENAELRRELGRR